MEGLSGHENNLLKDGELNGQLKNNSPNEWTDGELNGQLENNSLNGWTDGELMNGSKITR